MKLRKLHLFIIVLVAVAFSGWLLQASAAGSASLSLSPSSGSHDNGTNFTVTIKENSSDQVNTVEADLTYDQSKLQFVSIDASGSNFDFAISATGGSGSVKIARGVSGGATVSGSKTVAAVTFKVLAGSGSTPITFANSSAIVRPSDGQNVWNSVSTGGTYTLTTPVAAPSSGSSGSSSSGSSSSASSSSSKTSASSAAKPSTSTSAVPSAQQQAADPSSPVPVSKDVSTTLSQYLVAVKVVDNNGKPVENASVTLDGTTAKSDKTGVASFANVKPGVYKVDINSDKGSVKAATVTVVDGQPATDVQAYTLKVKKGTPWVLIIGIGLGIVLLLLVGRYLLKRMRANRPFSAGSYGPAQPQAIVSEMHNQEPQPVRGPAVPPGQIIQPAPRLDDK